MKLVAQEAQNFNDRVFSEINKLSIPQLSPVFYLNDPQVNEALGRIMKNIGSNLSTFNTEIRSLWEDAKFQDPLEVKKEYEKALKICDKYFDHNPRDFSDPFYDILRLVCKEYRTLTQTRRKKI